MALTACCKGFNERVDAVHCPPFVLCGTRLRREPGLDCSEQAAIEEGEKGDTGSRPEERKLTGERKGESRA